jgi:HK97 family phage major capsid protein
MFGMSTSTGTDWSGLLPAGVSARVIESAIKQYVVRQLATRQPMPTGVETAPVVSVAPQAGWVAAGQRKPIAKVEWSAEVLKAEEIAAVVAIPDVYISDTSGSWNPEASAEDDLAKAIGRAVDAAVLLALTRHRPSQPGGSLAWPPDPGRPHAPSPQCRRRRAS